MEWIGKISKSEQEKRKKFLFRFLKEKGVFTIFRNKFDPNFFHMYVSANKAGGRIKDFDDYLRFFLNSNYFSSIITYAFEWKRCGWPSENVDKNQHFWEHIANSFALTYSPT